MALGKFQESVPLCSLPFVFVIFVSLVFCCLYNIHFVRCMRASVIRGKISLNLISTLDRRGLDRKQISNQQ